MKSRPPRYDEAYFEGLSQWEAAMAHWPEHVISDSEPCWCCPRVEHYEHGDVVVHREVEDAS